MQPDLNDRRNRIFLRDVTPEATLAVCDRNAPGIAEAIRVYSMTITKRAMLSRGASAIRGSPDRKSAGQSKSGRGKPDLYLRFAGTWDGYFVGERWGMCAERIAVWC